MAQRCPVPPSAQLSPGPALSTCKQCYPLLCRDQAAFLQAARYVTTPIPSSYPVLAFLPCAGCFLQQSNHFKVLLEPVPRQSCSGHHVLCSYKQAGGCRALLSPRSALYTPVAASARSSASDAFGIISTELPFGWEHSPSRDEGDRAARSGFGAWVAPNTLLCLVSSLLQKGSGRPVCPPDGRQRSVDVLISPAGQELDTKHERRETSRAAVFL